MIEVSRLFRISGNKVLAKMAALLVGTAMMSAPGVIFADSIFPIQAGHEMATASLGRLLAERGWKVTREDDGSILLYPQQNAEQDHTEVVTVAESVVDIRQKASVPMIDTAYWQANLEPHGWGVEADPDGSVVLIPGAVKAATATAAPSASPLPDIPDLMDLTALRDRLSPHGWGVKRDLDGSVLLTPGAVEVQTVAVIPSISPRQEIPEQMDLAWLRDRLTPHGWGVERDLDGSLLLIPGAVDVQTVAIAPFVSSATPYSITTPVAAGTSHRVQLLAIPSWDASHSAI